MPWNFRFISFIFVLSLTLKNIVIYSFSRAIVNRGEKERTSFILIYNWYSASHKWLVFVLSHHKMYTQAHSINKPNEENAFVNICSSQVNTVHIHSMYTSHSHSFHTSLRIKTFVILGPTSGLMVILWYIIWNASNYSNATHFVFFFFFFFGFYKMNKMVRWFCRNFYQHGMDLGTIQTIRAHTLMSSNRF